MQEGLVTALLWLLFGGSHVVLSIPAIRTRMVARLGEAGFILVYSLLAIGTFGALVHYVALHRFAEPQASLLVTIPPVRGALIALSVIGFSLFVAAVLVYPRLPMATFRHRVMPVRGIQQLTRHPFFSGIAIWAASHALLAPSTVTFVFFIGVVVLSFVGGLHQDRRLGAELGEPYLAYVAATSFWPLVAVITKRQTINWREQPWFAYGVGIGASLGLYEVHADIFSHGGAYVIAVVSIGSILAILSSRARARRPRKES
ncbi:MAG: NnrU family protein [Polyangiales bacterium]